MTVYDNALATLAARVRGGDTGALTGLRQELEPRLTFVVRQVLRTGSDGSPLDRRILREVARTAGSGRPPAARDRESLVAQVTRRLCALVIAGLRRSQPAADPFKDTVLDV